MVLINNRSVCIFSRSFDTEISMQPSLFGSFLSAVSMIAKNISSDEVEAIILGKSKILYRSIDIKHDLNLIIIADQNDDDDALKIVLSQLSEQYLNIYKDKHINSELINYRYLKPFEKYVDKTIQIINERMGDEEIDQSKIAYFKEKYNIKPRQISLSFLFNTLKKNFAKVIYSIFIGRRIVISGDRALIKLLIDSLKLFTPNRILKTNYWANTLAETLVDIVGVPQDLLGLFVIDSVIIDLEKNTLIGIKNNKYFNNLVKKIKDLDTFQARAVYVDEINLLFERIVELLNIINTETVSDADLKKFGKKINKDILEIIEKTLIVNYPSSINKIKKFSNKIRKYAPS